MKLKSITLKNYRSVEEVQFDINQLADGSFTFGLIGVNEAGKSSILRGFNFPNISFGDITPKDYYDKGVPISLNYSYELDSQELKLFSNYVKSIPDYVLVREIDLKTITFKIAVQFGDIDFRNTILTPLMFDGKILEFEMDEILNNIFRHKLHKAIFWKADEKYLINGSISLSSFARNPENVSIPLRNCFKLAGIFDIEEQIDLLDDSTERERLREELSEKVTDHIKRVWPKHPIKISFEITEANIHFHVKDERAKGKAKTADQRSDGFKQFISFLLTLSAENINSELRNTIILLDEPETHLHPRAQEDLLKELITISKANNNIVFFATHSNYMIDKALLSRNYKVLKPEDKTSLTKFDDKLSSYASVNYDVFEIASTDYHNELYGKAQEIVDISNGTAFDNEIKKTLPDCMMKNYTHSKGSKFDCTLPTYIRHMIHHPENTNNKRFTESELEKSIILLISFINTIKAS